MIGGEPAAGPAEATHDFVADEENAVTIADRAQALQVTVGRNDDAVRAGDGFNENRGDGVAAFVSDRFLDLVEASLHELRIAVAVAIEMAAVFVRIEEAHDARNAGLIGPTPR